MPQAVGGGIQYLGCWTRVVRAGDTATDASTVFLEAVAVLLHMESLQ